MEPSLAKKGSEKRIEQIIRGITGLGSWAELCAKSIIDEFAVIPRDELPEDGQKVGFPWGDSRSLREVALGYLAHVERITGAESRKAARADELAEELSGFPGVNYRTLTPTAQAAIDRIIELESRP